MQSRNLACNPCSKVKPGSAGLSNKKHDLVLEPSQAKHYRPVLFQAVTKTGREHFLQPKQISLGHLSASLCVGLDRIALHLSIQQGPRRVIQGHSVVRAFLIVHANGAVQVH